MHKKNLLPRIIVSPIILTLLVVTYLLAAIKDFSLFLWYGGEWVTLRQGDAKRISDIYEQLKSNTNQS